MSSEKIFITKTGHCHITTDQILLTRDGVVGGLAKILHGKNIVRTLVIYGVLSAWLIWNSINKFTDGNTVSGFLYIFLSLFFILAIISSINNSGTNIIQRTKIRKIEFNKAIPGMTRAYFTVYFENEKGKLKKRLIMLPGSLTGGASATKDALQIMEEEFGTILKSL